MRALELNGLLGAQALSEAQALSGAQARRNVSVSMY